MIPHRPSLAWPWLLARLAHWPPLAHRVLLVLLVLWTAPWAAHAAAPQREPLRLSDALEAVAAWDTVRLLPDLHDRWGLDEVLARRGDFVLPTGPAASLGPRREAVWLHIPITVDAGDGRWVFDIDYPALNEAELYQVSNGRLVAQHRLGATQHFLSRPLPSRSHAVLLNLAPGQQHELFVRVKTSSAMVLPITLSKENAFHSREDRRQLVQGVMLGVAVALLVYSLAHWVSLREPLFGLYALMLLGTTTFFLDFFGILQQVLQYERTGIASSMSPLSVLLALPAGGFFVIRALGTRVNSPRIHKALLVVSGLSALGFLLAITGTIEYRVAQTAATALGPLVPLLSIPAAWTRARTGDRAALFMLIGWGAYMVGAFVMAGLLRGLLPANALTLNFFQWGTLAEMLAWLRVLGVHIEMVRRDAQRTEAERQALQSLAYTDALTGLPNRRGLQAAMTTALGRMQHDRMLAVYLLDLDGFKPVNDRFGHDVGDELLRQVAQRLPQQLRHGDVVARLGGDEFVVMAEGLAGEADAKRLGDKLLTAFREPFAVQGHTCRVGLTIGYALAPNDGQDGGDLLKRADAAMYAGKQAGRHCLRRGGASAGVAAMA